MNGIALGIVLAVAAYLLGLAAAALLYPEKARTFLGAFASSARAHYLEQAVRLVAAAGFLAYAPHMAFSHAFRVLGWILVVTTVLLLAVPWRWHQRFAGWAVPLATRHLMLYGLGSLALGCFVIAAVVAG